MQTTQDTDVRNAMAPLDPIFRRRIVALESAAVERVRSGDVNGALRAIFDDAGPLWTSTQDAGDICGSEVLDELCLRIGRDVRAAFLPFRHRVARKRPLYVYAVSELYRSGGHTRLLEDLVAAHPGVDHRVLWVRGEDAHEEEDIDEVIRAEGVNAIHRLRGEPIEKLRSGFRLLTELDPDVLVHLGHPHDPITLALMQKSSARQLVMIHIADCSFALGRTLPDAVHVALGPHFEAYAREAWGLETSHLPLSCPDPGPRAEHGHAPRSFVTVTSGSPHKFDLRWTPSYLDVLRARFGARDGTHIHFGDLTGEQLRAIQFARAEGGWCDRFIHVPHVSRLSFAMIEAGAALYLDSYPVGGARALVEAMAAGLPLCAASHNANLDGASFCYPGALLWRTPSELGPLLAGLSDAALARHGAIARSFFVRHHAFPVFVRRFDGVLRGDRAR
ncbi:MAG: hypothetical protein NVS4B13_09050 [Candidatus Elarobacter sp.]